MIEALILYELNSATLTMYGISKQISNHFSVLLTPSFGTIKPALNRLAKSEFIKFQKVMSEGGRPSVYYSITSKGKEELKNLIINEPCDNPAQFLNKSRLKLALANVLDEQEKKKLFKFIRLRTETIFLDVKKIQKENNLDFYQSVIFDNLNCEYKNFLSLLEGIERAG